MSSLLSTKVTKDTILDSFDALYSSIKKADLVKHAKVSKKVINDDTYEVQLTIDYMPIFGKANGEDISVSDGDLIKIIPDK